MKLDIFIKKGAHSTEDEINKQINDRERVAAAIENQNLWKLVENCINDDDWTNAWPKSINFFVSCDTLGDGNQNLNNLEFNKFEVLIQQLKI